MRCAARAVSGRGAVEYHKKPTGSALKGPPPCVSGRPDDDMEAAELILRKGLKSLPVVNDEGQLVGQVRRIDLLRHLL